MRTSLASLWPTQPCYADLELSPMALKIVKFDPQWIAFPLQNTTYNPMQMSSIVIMSNSKEPEHAKVCFLHFRLRVSYFFCQGGAVPWYSWSRDLFLCAKYLNSNTLADQTFQSLSEADWARTRFIFARLMF